MSHYGLLKDYRLREDAEDIRGTTLYGMRDEKLGKIDDVIFDHSTGDISYVVVDTGRLAPIADGTLAMPSVNPRGQRNGDDSVTMRAKYQHGSIRREARKHGSAVWTLRWRETNADGSTTRRKTPIGTVEEYRTKAAAWNACEFLRSTINRETSTPRTVGKLVTHYQAKEMSDESSKAYSTRTAYAVYLRNWIVPVWGEPPCLM